MSDNAYRSELIFFDEKSLIPSDNNQRVSKTTCSKTVYFAPTTSSVYKIKNVEIYTIDKCPID